ncbi:MAG: crosslink repair DNA glycosylase YcaQ family protein, partial [Pseudomonadota bacterium]
LEIPNRAARRLWLWTTGLAPTPTGPLDVGAIIDRIGFLQIDTIRNVTRAHNHLVWTRNQNFREGQLWPLLSRRQLFEHFTHDASLIPMEVYPYWRTQFARLGAKVAASPWYASGLGRRAVADIKGRIAREGALSTHAFDTRIEGPREMWARPPHKKALDAMWYAGELSTCFRENFVKYYNLTERVVPAPLRDADLPDDACQDWLNRRALDRLSMATTGDLQRFWGAMSATEARAWAAEARGLVPLRVEGADGTWRDAWGTEDIEARLAACPAPTTRLRVLNPFDPAVRDRTRLARLFGFEYVNEMFVPAAQRRWGYYVYPVLEADRFVGRVEVKADRGAGWMRLTGFWPEPGVRWSAARVGRLAAELLRFARLAGIGTVDMDMLDRRME